MVAAANVGSCPPSLLPIPPDEFFNPGLAFRREDNKYNDGNEDEDNVGHDLWGRDKGVSRMTKMAETMAGGGLPSKHGGGGRGGAPTTVTMLTTQAAALSPPPPNTSLADILRKRRDMARKLLSLGGNDNDNSNGSNYNATAEPTSWF